MIGFRNSTILNCFIFQAFSFFRSRLYLESVAMHNWRPAHSQCNANDSEGKQPKAILQRPLKNTCFCYSRPIRQSQDYNCTSCNNMTSLKFDVLDSNFCWIRPCEFRWLNETIFFEEKKIPSSFFWRFSTFQWKKIIQSLWRMYSKIYWLDCIFKGKKIDPYLERSR